MIAAHSPPRRRRLRVLLAAAVVFAAALPAAAEAATLTTSGSTIQYTAAAGETNGLRVFKDAGGRTVLDDVVPISETSASCVKLDATSARCAIATPTIFALLGDRNDNVFTQNSIPMTVNAGSGSDSYLGGFAQGASSVTFLGSTGTDVADYRNASAAVTVKKESFANDGRAGDRDNIASDVENLVGSRFNDTLEGSNAAATERYDGLAGADTMRGLGGPDDFAAGTAPDGADKVFGGTGTAMDTMSYRDRTARVVVTTNFFDNDDGQAGEGDTVREIERVLGGSGPDQLSGNGGSQTRVLLFGGGNIDRLTGTAAGDTLNGEAGADTVIGNDGDDVINAIDRELDTIFCGFGIDTADRDLAEGTVSLCEGGIVVP
jgi:Ca2+-binding RTX toxin-like protein